MLGMKKASAMIVAVIAASVLATGKVAAQNTESRVLEEIIVMAQKRAEPLQDVPISMVVWDGRKISSTDIANLEELSAYIPSLTIHRAPITDIVSIRGVQSYLNAGFEQSVGIFSDNVYRGRGVQSRFAFFDIDRVEVLRGPQDTLFGNNTIAGSVNITSNRPTDDFAGGLSVLQEFRHDETVINGFLSGPLANKIRGRVAIITRQLDDGWVKNIFYDETAPNIDEFAARGMLEWDVTENLDVRIKYEHGSFDNGVQPSEISVAAPPLGPMAPNGGVDGTVNFVSNTGNTSPEINRGTAQFHDGTTDEFALDATLELTSGSTITAVVGRSEYDYERFFDADGNPFDAIGLSDPEDFDQTTLELRFSSATDQRFEYLGGLFLLDSDLTSESFGGINVIDPLATIPFGDVDQDGDIEFINVADPNAAALFNAFATAGNPNAALLPFLNDFTRYTVLNQKTESLALFGQASWNISDRVSLTVGLRYTDTDKSGTQGAVCLPFGSESFADRDPGCEFLPDLPAIFETAAQLDPANPDPAILATLASLVNGRELALVAESVAHIQDVSRNESHVSGHIDVSWDVTDNALLYGTIRTGFKAGGFNAVALTPGELDFSDEEVLSLEAGAKLTLLEGAAQLNVAVFDMDYDDLQVSQFTGNTSFIVRNAAQASIRGIELDGRWRATERLQISGAFAWNDFEFDDHRNAGCTIPQQLATALTADACAAAGINDLTGRPNVRSPEFTASATLDYDLPLGQYELNGALDWIWRGEQFTADDLDPVTKVDAYSLLNLTLTFGPQDGPWAISLIGKNLTDEDYFLVADDLPLFALSYSRGRERPRSIAIRAEFSF